MNTNHPPRNTPPLPIDEVLPELVAALARRGAAVLHAPTGAGKTTRVPPALLDAGLAGDAGRVVVLEPRRIAARAAARRVASERGEQVGQTVGYQVRFDRRVGPRTRIVFVTPGILVRMLQADPFAEGIAAVVFDEFHERSVDSDLALAMVRSVRDALRDDLRIVVMSATLAAEPIAAWLGHDVPVVESRGRLHPIDLEHARSGGAPDHRDLPERAADAVRRVLERQRTGDAPDGDVLVFLPGMREIRRTEQALGALGPFGSDVRVLPLHGRLPAEAQDAVFAPYTGRKIVLATNVAETSLTIPGVAVVIDGGLARVMRHDPNIGLDRLELERISRESATQRAGRAGRERPGLCLRLWTELDDARLNETTPPEIRRVDLMPVALQLLCWGETDLDAFGWFEPPDAAGLELALDGLQRLGALDRARMPTALGRAMASLPAHPRVARLLLEGAARGVAERAALVAAVISEPDLGSDPGARPTRSDVLDASETVERLARQRGRPGSERAGWLLRVRDQLARAVEEVDRAALPQLAGEPHEALLRCILAAYPDRVAQRRAPGDERAVMVGARGVRLGRDSRLTRDEMLFVAVDVAAARRGERSEAWVRKASAVEEAWLDPVETHVDVDFDDKSGRVVAVARRCYGGDATTGLVLDERPAPLPGGGAVARCLASAATERLGEVLGLDDEESAVTQLLARLDSLRAWAPGLELPALDDQALAEVVAAHCPGHRSLAELRRVDWTSALRGRLGWNTARELDALCPTSLTIPSGRDKRLVYHRDTRPPVLAVRIQEMFGQPETPRIAGGRVAIILHLLAPNMRPQQITDDLASFWKNGYPEVRKELRARYPKHAWPEDPLEAKPKGR